jgi:hypothetical protein
MTGDPSTGNAGTTEPPGAKTALDMAADLLVYAPLGFAVAARELLPTLAERGRSEMASQVSLARMVGQLVVRQGQDEIGRAVGGARQQVGAIFDQFLRTLTDDVSESDEPTAGSATGPVAATPTVSTTAVEPAVAPDEPISLAGEGRGPADAALATALAIPDYDSLAASQVIPRLAALAPDELEAVRHYEASTRARRTILGRVAQLQG